MKPKIIIIFTVLAAHFSFAQDSLVKYTDLQFRNEHEQSTLKAFQIRGSKTDLVDLFMVHYSISENYSVLNAHRQIEEAVSLLKKETEGLSEPKKIKRVFEYVHKRFFKVYQHDNSFPDVFKSGDYNCVSGSAVYGIVLDKMGIPYQIMEAPQHVYLFAYPQTHRILIETTIPKNGYLTFDNVYIQRFVNYLSENKLISQKEADSYSARDLFNKYYFNKNGLTIQQLAAIQYDNYAAYHTEKAEFEKALIEAKKAYYLDPGERNAYIVLELLKEVISNGNYSSEKETDNLILLCRYHNRNSKEVSSEAIQHEFKRLTYDRLVKDAKPDSYTKAFESIYSELKDDSLKAEIAFIYHYELARVNILSYKDLSIELKHLKDAYDINPKHTDLQSIIRTLILLQVEKNSDPVKLIKELEGFATQFGFLEVDNSFNGIRSNSYLDLAYQFVELNDIARGETELKRFEALYERNPELKISDRFVEKAYSSAAAYYFKRGNKVKTKEVLTRGLKYAPDNFGLKIRLSQVH